MPETTCVFCGNCVAVCPTNALRSKTEFLMEQELGQEKHKVLKKEKSVRSTCPYCGVGCQIDLQIKDHKIVRVDAPFDVAPNYGRLCSKGRFGIDYVHHPSRLTHPLIRKKIGVKPRQAVGLEGFREAGWDEALDLAADKIAEIVRQKGGDAIGTFCSAKATNEDNYVFQKFVRSVIGTNNVDHCARLCHAASVAGLQIAIGSPAMSNSIAEMKNLDVFIVTGSNTSETHPVISTFLREAVVKNGARLIVVDPRQIEMTRFATRWLRQKPGTDVVVFQAMAQVIIQEKRYDEGFIRERVEGFDNYAASIQHCTPEWAETISGVPAEEIRQAARLYADAERAAIYWGMGISQSVHGTDNALSLANLALLSGNLGKAGTGLNPLRGQNSVQGCSDSGGLPNIFPGYQSVTDPEIRAKFEQEWGVPLNPEAGLTTMEMVDAAEKGVIRSYYVMGENPMMNEPDLGHARQVMQALDFVLVQDIFMNETAAYADIILPATSFAEKDGTFTNSDRRVQLIRKAVPAPGIARSDWKIVADLARRVESRLGRKKSAGFDFDSPDVIWDEMAGLTPPFQGITHARIAREDGIHWPCPTPDHPGTPYLFADTFPSGKGKLTPLNYRPSQELPDEEYPLLLSTGRVLYHWHGGTMTRRSKLDDIYPDPTVEVHPQDAKPLNIRAGDWIKVRSRRGEIRVKALITERSRPGMVFIPIHFAEAAANELTLDARDPQAKNPDYKISAVVIERT
ncbi:MAG: formate dehydrogenase subunit alpha [Deltaproteobacteria bacterium]|nr:formate dehydrogenase subunit alpha [Deltaproteobacteria bacterium]